MNCVLEDVQKWITKTIIPHDKDLSESDVCCGQYMNINKIKMLLDNPVFYMVGMRTEGVTILETYLSKIREIKGLVGDFCFELIVLCGKMKIELDFDKISKPFNILVKDLDYEGCFIFFKKTTDLMDSLSIDMIEVIKKESSKKDIKIYKDRCCATLERLFFEYIKLAGRFRFDLGEQIDKTLDSYKRLDRTYLNQHFIKGNTIVTEIENKIK